MIVYLGIFCSGLTQAMNGSNKIILRCFKEISGIWNPFHYHELGRVIPTIQDGITTLVSTAANPKLAIMSSPGYCRNLNNDQEIVIEKNEKIAIVLTQIRPYVP